MIKDIDEEKKEKIDSFFGKGDKGGVDLGGEPEPSKRKPGLSSHGSFHGLLLFLIVIVVVGVLIWALKGGVGGQKEIREVIKEKGATAVDTLKLDEGKYQAVFLTNGQVYFGKVRAHDTEYVELTDVYYLQVVPVLQQKDEEGGETKQQEQQQQQQQLSLVKLGNELHGPLDRMMINKQQVMFVEDMKDDSKVTDAIRKYQEDQRKQKGE